MQCNAMQSNALSAWGGKVRTSHFSRSSLLPFQRSGYIYIYIYIIEKKRTHYIYETKRTHLLRPSAQVDQRVESSGRQMWREVSLQRRQQRTTQHHALLHQHTAAANTTISSSSSSS